MLQGIKFLNHASFLVNGDGSILLIDPWMEGAAFNNGWSLLDSSTSNNKLVDELVSINKKIYIWYSHEHSDHLSLSFLRLLKEREINVHILFQYTLDKRVLKFLKKLSFNATEVLDGSPFEIEENFSITTWRYNKGDSYCLILYKGISILNLNDCVIQNNTELIKLKIAISQYVERLDVLFTQFGYANWIGNPNDQDLRINAANEKNTVILSQEKSLSPNYIVPFASFIYFSDVENFYMNDYQNSPLKIRNAAILKEIQSKIIFMKYNDQVSFEEIKQKSWKQSRDTEHYWQNLISNIKPSNHQPQLKKKEELKKIISKYVREMNINFLFFPMILEMIGVIKKVRVKIKDLDLIVDLSFLHTSYLKNNNSDFDIQITSTNLHAALEREYGFNTLGINGKFFTTSMYSKRKFELFFSFQEYFKNGYGLHHPVMTCIAFINILKRKVARSKIFIKTN